MRLWISFRREYLTHMCLAYIINTTRRSYKIGWNNKLQKNSSTNGLIQVRLIGVNLIQTVLQRVYAYGR